MDMMTATLRLLLLIVSVSAPIYAAEGSPTQTQPALSNSGTTKTGTYLTYTSQITLLSSSTLESKANGNNVTQVQVSTADDAVTYITGKPHTTTSTQTGNFSATSSSGAEATPVNTRPCNNYPEFCSRKYSNITEIACHNSPFTTPKSLAANQQYDVTTQLNDGIRFLQAQIQYPSNESEPHFCHSSCDVLDAGPIGGWLTKVKDWVAKHPYDVVTILLGNGNYSSPEQLAPYIESTGIVEYAYRPPMVPMLLNDWPTLGEMILSGKRVVMFMDYQANQTQYPWLLDEFSQMWETPFDPTNKTFPCTVQRPPDLPSDQAKNRMYLVNHNLNLVLSFNGNSGLVPIRTELNVTNNVTGAGSLGANARDCQNEWNRAPNFLNVDYYNHGGFPGSVFEVAAQMNNVTYTRACCGTHSSSGASRVGTSHLDKEALWAVGLGLALGYSVLLAL